MFDFRSRFMNDQDRVLGASNELASFLDIMTDCADATSRWQKLVAFMARQGADQINYAVLNTLEHRREEAPVTQLSTMPDDWINFYLDERLDLCDPHVHYVRSGNISPYRWTEDMLSSLENDKQQQVIALAAEAGLRAQVSLIAPDPIGGSEPIGGMTIGSSLSGRDFFRSVSGKEEMLLSAGMVFHQLSIGEIRRHQVGAQRLSPRERDCMCYVALGLRSTRIAEKLNVSEVTVELHLRNARKKLRAATTAQAVARAMIFGDISI
ncbi:MAG: hypothetical protein C0499_01105 [Zymomonas sp.]|nr:hypothetical protein [Zymomonas sp.]